MKPFADHFSRISAGYAAYRPGYPEALFDAVARAAPARRLAWDCATGTGQAAVGLAGRFQRVIATDASRRQVRDGVPHPRVRYAATEAERSALRTRSADLVTVAQALHWLDLEPFYAEVRRVLVPGGRVVFVDHVVAPPHTLKYVVQRVATPFSKRFCHGCHWDRDTEQALASAGFTGVDVRRLRVRSMPFGPVPMLLFDGRAPGA